MSREVSCAGLGLGLSLDEDDVCAFITLGEDPEDEDASVYFVRLSLDRLNEVIGTLMSMANEMSTLEMELANSPEVDRKALLMRIASRYSAKFN